MADESYPSSFQPPTPSATPHASSESDLANVKYTALFSGVVYGAYHTSTLKSTAEKAHAEKLYAKKEALILEAKAKYAELNKKAEVAPVAATSTAEINFDDDKLDFGAVILAAVENLKQ
ncbi:hypothetical protein WICPIJ_000185 [Wickerhamomyces pijperi]|uniref:ATP synthase F(0) complex subunit e, mitochondrial n=1 Tax=Wickerhamomyces pijperi TaxID=599730 RepID=A0A9P8QHF9_WICPI|nr:hypothetical protein WICPIJ_000185 [Wickerhamomyces pijperi]